MWTVNTPAYRRFRPVWCFWSPPAEYWIWKSENSSHGQRKRRKGRVRFQSSPEGQVRLLVWNILTLYIASIKDVLIITPPFLSVASSSSLLPSSICLSLFPSLYPISPFCLSPPFFPSFPPLPSPFLSSPLPNVFLSGLRWNRKCWFNNSWWEFWAGCWFSQLPVQHRRCSSSLTFSSFYTE